MTPTLTTLKKKGKKMYKEQAYYTKAAYTQAPTIKQSFKKEK